LKTYTIVGGVNGAGKSSLTGVLRTEINNLGKIIDVDKITVQCGGSPIEGGKKALSIIDDCLEKEVCFTQETTLSGHKTIDTIKRAIELGYNVRLYYVAVNTAEESLERIKNRVLKGGHNINTDDVHRRFNKRFEDLILVLPYCNEATFYDNENGFVTIAKYQNGEIIKVGSQNPIWFQEFLKEFEKN